ncbi:hypothetical protein GCM10020000_07970 [Streptomyces olivoverticillatus]
MSILAIGLAGIGQLGARFWVTPLFNGVTLLIAVGLAELRRPLGNCATDGRARPRHPQPARSHPVTPSRPLP